MHGYLCKCRHCLRRFTYGWHVFCMSLCLCVQAGSLCAPSGSVGAVERCRRPRTCAASNQRLALPEHHTLHAACTWTLCATYHWLPAKQDSRGNWIPKTKSQLCISGVWFFTQLYITDNSYTKGLLIQNHLTLHKLVVLSCWVTLTKNGLSFYDTV